MIVYCSKDTLQEHASIVSKAVSSRSTLPILECVLLSADVGGSLRLTANDLEIAIQSGAIDAVVDRPGDVALEARMFFEIVRRLPDGDVRIETGDNFVTLIRCRDCEFTIIGQDPMEFPTMPVVAKERQYTMPAPDLKAMIRKTIFSVSQDETKPTLTGELLEVKNGFLNVVAVDGFRVSFCRAETEETDAAFSIIVPSKTMYELSRVLPQHESETVSLYFTDKHVLLETSGYTIVSRVINGDFIMYEPLFENNFTTVVTADRARLLMGIERAALIAFKEVRKNPVTLTVENGAVTVSTRAQTGAVTDVVNAELDGADIAISFNPRYLTDILRTIEDDTVILAFTTPLSPCVIRGANEKETKYLVLPLRQG